MVSVPFIEKSFIPIYAVSGPIQSEYKDSADDSNQLRYEKKLRHDIVSFPDSYPAGDKSLGSISRLGVPWKSNYSHGNIFLERNCTSVGLTRIELDAYAYLIADQKCTARIRVWSYMAVLMFMNGIECGRMDAPVYKPMAFIDVDVELGKGANEIYLVLQNLGVRDSRNMIGLELRSADGKVSAGFQDERISELKSWFDSISLNGRCLSFPSPAFPGTLIGFDSKSMDQYAKKIEWESIDGMDSYCIDRPESKVIVKLESPECVFKREFEILSRIKAEYSPYRDDKENFARYLNAVASERSLRRGAGYGFPIANILARKAIGKPAPYDMEEFNHTLNLIERRIDCADFLITGVVRYMKNYELPSDIRERAKNVLLDFRYWMNMKGTDSMCFWSENHSLLFYSSAYIVGSMYPDSYFPRAGMNGRELSQYGRRLTDEWLDDVLENGFEEFLSTVYMCITSAGLLNVIDYSDPEISDKATRVMDEMLRIHAIHTFDGSVIAPMGRVYRDVLYSAKSGAQTILNIIDPSNPVANQVWFSYYATSSYQFSDELKSIMKAPVKMNYVTGNARVFIEKTEDYILTSVQSPRKDEFKRWSNITLGSDAEFVESHEYTKSLNERYHGTTCFQPGVYGYQQHLYDIALSNMAHVFANHPGVTDDATANRPGYWYGNGVMPAVTQSDGAIYAIYSIPDEHPVKFTHIYFPKSEFDSSEISDSLIFARKGNGFIAIWHSGELVAHDDVLSDAEMRCYDSVAAYAFFASSENKESYEDFKKRVRSMMPEFRKEERSLYSDDKLILCYESSFDDTQFI